MDAGRLGEELVNEIIILVVLAFVFGLFIMWIAPKIWHWLVPILHRIT